MQLSEATLGLIANDMIELLRFDFVVKGQIVRKTDRLTKFKLDKVFLNITMEAILVEILKLRFVACAYRATFVYPPPSK